MPSITTSTRPRAGNEPKFFTDSARMRRSPSALSRLTAATVLPVAGLVTATPAMAASHEAISTSAQMAMKIITGSGSLLPTFSTPSRKRSTRVRLGTAVVGAVISVSLVLIERVAG